MGISPFLEGGILSTSLEEVFVGTVQMTKGLLNGDRGDIGEPGILFLQVGKHGREVVVGQLSTMLEVGSFTGAEAPIVHKATTSERLRKNTLLSVGR